MGCTIIELLTGKPPYLDLDPMAALFRIVQDDFPPLPEGISQALRDFLLLCFQKEPMLRKTADKLLEHPWLQNQSNALNNPTDLLPNGKGVPGNDADTQVIVNTIKLFQQDAKSHTNKQGGEGSAPPPATLKPPKMPSGQAKGRQDAEQSGAVPAPASVAAPAHANRPAKTHGHSDREPMHSDITHDKLSSGRLTEEDSHDSDPENWDDDLDQQTVRLSEVAVSSPKNVSRMNIADIADFVAEEDNVLEGQRPPPVRGVAAARGGRSGPGHVRTATHVNAAGLGPNLSRYQEKDENMDDFTFNDISDAPGAASLPANAMPPALPSLSQSSVRTSNGQALSPQAPLVGQEPMAAVLQQRLRQAAVEVDADAFDDFQFDENDFQQNETRDVDIRRSREIRQLMASIKPDSPEKDVIDKCNQLLVMFEKYPEQREHLITQHGVLPVLDMLEARSGLRPNIPVLDMLEARSGSVRPHVLRVINTIMEGSARAQEQLSLVGLIPIVMRLLEYSPNPKHKGNITSVDPVVLEAARFVHQISSTTSLTLQMLIGAGGLPVLVHMVTFSHHMGGNGDARRMVFMGLDCIVQVFSVQSSRTRDFCKLFVKLGILPHLTAAFTNVMKLNYTPSRKPLSKSNVLSGADGSATPPSSHSKLMWDAGISNSEDMKYAHRIASIFWIFSRYEIAENMAREGVLDVIVAALGDSNLTDPVDRFRHLYDHQEGFGKLSPEFVEIVELLLKCVKNLSMEPSALVDLERVGLFNILVPLLDGPIRDKCKNHVLPCIFNLCRINKRRQEQAALRGLIPHLQRLIVEGSHLKQFALPIICDFAHTSAVVREELWKSNGVVFYINLLREKYWQTFALNSLAVWYVCVCYSLLSMFRKLFETQSTTHVMRIGGIYTIMTGVCFEWYLQ